MTGRRAALALALSLVVGACIPPTTQVPSPTATTSANTTASPVAGSSEPPRSPAPTPATILALDVGRRPSGPWAVTFQLIGSPAFREVYVLAPACAEASCDINATIQTFAGEPLGTGVFHFADGMYRYEADRTETVECSDGIETIPDGATRVSHTILLIAGYRPVGTAVVSVDIQGTRAVEVTPVGGSGCSAESLDYTANGEATKFAVAPTPTPKPTAAPTVPVIGASFFGSGAKVVSYQVSGNSMTQIISSIRANGPWSDWLHARAEAVTKAVPKYRFTLSETAGVCHIVTTARPAVIFTYTITLPGWSRPKTADAATVRWWAGELLRVATHERHHVEIYRDGAALMTDAVAHSTCVNVSSKIAAIVKDIDIQQCQFDVDEYGAALGLTLSSCLAQ
jgi:predicted secreted Zn-dependent protease